MPTFCNKSADQELYWCVEGNNVVLTDKIKNASVFQTDIHEDGGSFYITTATKRPATIWAKKPKWFKHPIDRLQKKRELRAMQANAGDQDFCFELRRTPPKPFSKILDASEAVTEWKNGDYFFLKPADTSNDDTALAIRNCSSHNRLVSMLKHAEEDKQGTYYMSWSCIKIARPKE